MCYDARCIQASDLKIICGRVALSNVNVIKHSCSEADLEETLTKPFFPEIFISDSLRRFLAATSWPDYPGNRS